MEFEGAGLRVRADRSHSVAALRHFEAAAFGLALPGPLEARRMAQEGMLHGAILAWRSPSETWLLGADPADIHELQARTVGSTQCCVVEQTGGIAALRVGGERRAELIERLGSSTAVPRPGQALTSRLAEVTVMTLCVDADEILLLVERVYLDHLTAWIRETLADF